MSKIGNPDIAAIRFGFGLGGEQHFSSAKEIYANLVGAETVPDALSAHDSARRLKEAQANRRGLRDMIKNGMEADVANARKGYRSLILDNLYQDMNQRLIIAVETPHPVFERLVAFWSNHFAVSTRKSLLLRAIAGPYETEAIRPNILGNFEDLLTAAVLHPAMLLYLDQGLSVGPNSRSGKKRGKGLNENLAREILELHTLGVSGGYDQQDVTEFAKLLTGWTVNKRIGKTIFSKNRSEPGPKTILGKKYAGGREQGQDVIKFLKRLAIHPSTAKFIATKLARHYVSDNPPENVVNRLADRFLDTGGNLSAVYEVLFQAPEVWEQSGSKAKSPFDFVISGLRATGIKSKALMPTRNRKGRVKANPLFVGALSTMRQPLWEVPSPQGWPDEAKSWITPASLTDRLNWISKVVDHIDDENPGKFLEHCLGSVASERTRSIVLNASTREEGLALVLASPEFNRR